MRIEVQKSQLEQTMHDFKEAAAKAQREYQIVRDAYYKVCMGNDVMTSSQKEDVAARVLVIRHKNR